MHRSISVLLALCSVCLLAVAGWMTVHRETGYDVMFNTRQVLEPTPTNTRITAIERGEDRTLRLEISTDSHEGETNNDVAILSFKAGAQDLIVDAGDAPTIQLSTLAGENISIPVVSNVNVPMAGSLPFNLDNFVIRVPPEGSSLWMKANQVIEEFGVVPTDSNQEKVLKIAEGLHRQLYSSRGVPSAAMRHLDGWDQYRAALEGRSGVYCANHAEIFAFFATVSGVPTRLVDVGGRFSDIAVAAHAFAESYIPELGGWAYVDLQLHTALLTDSSNTALSGIDVLYRVSRGDWSGIRPVLLGDRDFEELERFDEDKAFELIRTFLPRESTLTYLWAVDGDRYAFRQRLQRLLVSPQPAFSLVHSKGDARDRLALTYLGMALFVISVIAYFIGRWRIDR